MQKEVFLDLDQVLVDLVTGVCKYHKMENPYLKPENYGRYDIRGMVGMSYAEFWGALDHDFWLDLEWMPDGKEILQLVLSYVKRSQITILTAPTGFQYCADGKIAWIKKNLPGFNFLIGPRKDSVAAPNKLLIDDHDSHIDKWMINGPALQVPRLSNRLYDQPTIPFMEHCLEIYFANDHD